MRILYSHRIQSRDGQSVHVEELVRALREAGHEVLVVGPRFYEQSGFGSESRLVSLIRRLLPGALGELAELAYNLPAYRRLARACDGFRPDAIYERYNLYYLAGTWLARRRRLPLLLEVNSPLAEERIRFGGLQLHRLAHAVERRVWRAATRVLPVTGVLADIIAAAGVPRARISVVPNGIVLARFPSPAPRPAPALLMLGFVGFVRAWHGMDGVLRAIAGQATRPVGLTLIGDGPARPELEALAAELGLAARVRFTGLIDPAEVPGQVARFDIALQPQVTPYASPLKIFDYMAAGCAIVAPDQPNIREVLRHEHTALLFNPEADGAMWQAISRLIDDPDLRLRLGAAARAELEARDYTWAGNAGRVAGMAQQGSSAFLKKSAQKTSSPGVSAAGADSQE